MKFRKKPVVIEAVRIADVLDKIGAQPPWVQQAYAAARLSRSGNELLVVTPEGVMRAGRNSWLVRGVAGELYFCLPEIFEATYEAIA